MAVNNRLGLRGLWFQAHKWIGILLVVLIIPLSLTGAALVWHDWLDETVNPGRYAVSGGEATLPPSAYVAAAATQFAAGDRISQLRFPEHGGPLTVVAARAPQPGAAKPGPPLRLTVWLNPADGRVLDAAPSNQGLVRWLHVFHGNLMVPGVGRQVVGWLGVAMLLSCVSGLWLWWPSIGRWTRGLRWGRTRHIDANLHHQAGFWIAIPLAMLSFTGVWISFPQFFATLAGGAQQQERGGLMQRMRARPLEATRLSADQALGTALAEAAGRPVTIAWPTDAAPEWRISVNRTAGGPIDVAVDEATGAAELQKPRGQGGIARTMRRLHDGTGMGAVWQVIIFLGGIVPALLGVTGIIMWLRTRGWRADVARRRRGRGGTPASEIA